MQRIYKQKQFDLYSNFNNGYIIYNRQKSFDDGHTHLNNYNTARYLIKLAFHRIVPTHLSIYLIDSLIRISTDEMYIKKLNCLRQKELKNQKNNKKT